MSKKTIYIVIILLAIVGLLFWFGRPDGQEVTDGSVSGDNTATEALLPTVSAYDFGTISMAKGVVKYDYEIENTLAIPVTITKLYTSCMCTKANLITRTGTKGPFGMPGHGLSVPTISEIVEPGDKFTVEAIFDPAAHGPSGIGRIERAVVLETSEGNLELNFSANVTP